MTKLRLDYYSAKRAKLPKALMKRIKLHRLGRTSGYTVWVVDGAVIRAEVDIDFAIGGNPARYSYVPENEVWLEATGDDDDMKATFMHEIMEADAMRRGYSYDEAHEWASHGEAKIRELGGDALPVFLPNPSETDMGGDWHGGMEETPQQIADHGHYGFWLSPEGDCYVVEGPYEHWQVAADLCKALGVFLGEVDLQKRLEDMGWVKVSGLPNNFGYGCGEQHVFTQAQLNALFDLAGALDPSSRKTVHKFLAIEIKRRDEVRGNPAAPILTLCSWCQGVIFDGPVGPQGAVTHGICYPCAVEHAEEFGLTDEDLEEMREEQEARKNPDDEYGVVASWRAWVAAADTPDRAARRKLLVQVINAKVLAYRWQAFDKAVENMRFMGATYEETARLGTSSVLHEAATICARLGWDAAEIRRSY